MTVALPFSVTVDGSGPQALQVAGEPVVLVISGELDIATCPALRRAIGSVLEAGHADLVIDVGAVEFIDARGISVLVRAAEDAWKAGGRLVLREPSATMRRLLRLLHLNGMLPEEK
jgi:anti-sigma B factor antagonist